MTLLCAVLGIARSSYYKWKNRTPSLSEIKDQQLMDWIMSAYTSFKGIYGYRRMTIYLNHFKQARVNHKRVYRLMKILGLKAVIRVKKVQRKLTRPDYVQENKLNRQFTTQHPMEKLLTDITEFKLTNGQKVYLSAIYDLHTKKIIAHQMDTRCEQSLVNRTFNTINSKVIHGKTIIHSDRGSQYTSHMFKRYVKKNGLIHSMSRPGKCIDNGPMENVWGIIKTERFKLNTYQSIEDLKQDIRAYIKFSNHKRVTLNMGLKIPA